MQKPFVESVRFLAGGCSSFCDHIEILLVMQVKVPTTYGFDTGCFIVVSSGIAYLAFGR